ncbi:MFS transporter [Brevibacterium sp. HMSC24B04]|uniref:MFS transporter n=1 Tax=Brevibacterium sp. HMSC24B04 TaxID=1581060 RepID=UPI0008A2D36B|nr:MFS transporter [Brevibacterium sp. HMSC24B04]OFT93492.1 MFS transporter [Brevibacterium sp. HMSC24B04]
MTTTATPAGGDTSPPGTSATSTSAAGNSGPPTPRELRRVRAASFAGTTIEFYDFFIYGTAAALVFPTVFFPALGSGAALVASFATFGVGFVARPVGSIFFGHFGDRIGRKQSLISTLLIMGAATVLMGLIPPAAQIGVAAPIILVTLRFLQGFAVGGEWAGAALLTAEYAPKDKRGLYGAFPQLGTPAGMFLANATFLVSALVAGDSSEAFLTYGWRIPFVASALLIAIGLWVRLSIAETPAFIQAQAAAEEALKREAEDADAGEAGGRKLRERSPFIDVFRFQAREVLLASGCLVMLFAFFHTSTSFLTSYASDPEGIGLPRTVVLAINMLAAVVLGVTVVLAGWLSDRFGRRRLLIFGFATGTVWALFIFPVISIGTGAAFALAQCLTLLFYACAYGPLGSYLPELFKPRYRYTGAGLGYNIGGILGGGIVPIVASAISATYGGTGIGLLLSATGVISLVCAWLLQETRGQALDHEEPAEASLAEEPVPAAV